MHHGGYNLHDSLVVALCLALIWSFMLMAVTRIFLSGKAREGERFIRQMQSHVDLPEMEEDDAPEVDVVLPPERRVRTRYDDAVNTPWDELGPDERAEAALKVLPVHYEDSNGITATDVAHRLGLKSANRVAPALKSLVKSGQAHQHWDKGSKRRRVYWRTSG